MKTKILLAALALVQLPLFGQKKIEVRESNENIGGGSHSAMTVTVVAKEKDDVEDAIRSFMKGMDAKTSSGKGEIYGEKAKTKAMGEKYFYIYGKVEEVKGEGFKMTIAVDLGGAYLNSAEHKDQFKHIKDKVYELAVKIQKDAVGEDLKAAEKLLEKYEDEQKDLEKDNKESKEDIEDYKKKITEAEEKIKKNEEDQKKKKEEIEAQKKVVKEVTDKMNAVK